MFQIDTGRGAVILAAGMDGFRRETADIFGQRVIGEHAVARLDVELRGRSATVSVRVVERAGDLLEI